MAQAGLTDDNGIWRFDPMTKPVIGIFNLASLPAAADNTAKYAFVTDLGGGADMLISDGTNWKHIRPGKATSIAVAASLLITPLQSPPIMVLSGTINSAANIALQPQNLYPGYSLTVVVPAGVLGILGSLGVALAGFASIPLLGGSWADYSYDGAKLVKIRGGSL